MPITLLTYGAIYRHKSFLKRRSIDMSFSAMNIPQLETERLLMREWRESDLEMVAEIYADEETARYIGGTKPRWQAWRQMAAYIGHWQLRGFGFWVLEEKDSLNTIGYCGLWAPESWPENEVGYGLLPKFQGKGYVSEAAIESLKYAYSVLNWTTAISFIDANNIASQRVAERMGAIKEGSSLLFDEMPADIWRHLPPAEFKEKFS
ncbi:MAG: GNAT family N-acetyltransferase [Pseudomonadota bacterium]